MDPKYDRDDHDLDATVRNLRALVDAPGDLSFRRSIGDSFEKVTDKLGRIESRLARIEERQLDRSTIAQLVQKEMDATIKDVARIEKILWGTIGTFGGTIIVTAVAILVTKAMK